jgi:hypothetical protein
MPTTFVQFGGDEIQPFHQSVASSEPAGGAKHFLAHGQRVLHDRRPFGEHLPIVHLQSRDTAQGIDGLVINTRLSHFGAEISLF